MYILKKREMLFLLCEIPGFRRLQCILTKHQTICISIVKLYLVVFKYDYKYDVYKIQYTTMIFIWKLYLKIELEMKLQQKFEIRLEIGLDKTVV